jgi:hypothetical protein
VNRPRSADDFATIRARMEELRRERERAQASEADLPCDPPIPRARTNRWPPREIGEETGPGPTIWCGTHIAIPGIKLFGRDRIPAGDLLGGYLAGCGSAEDSHLSAGRPPHCIGARKTITPLRIVGHVTPPGQYQCCQFITVADDSRADGAGAAGGRGRDG